MVHPDLKGPEYPDRMLSTGLGRYAHGTFCELTELVIELSKGPVRKGFWVCPCGRRCTVVYRKPHGDRQWLCRECAGWRYASAALHSNGNGRYERLKLQFDRLAGIIGPLGLDCPARMRDKTWATLDDRLVSIKTAMIDSASREQGSAATRKFRALGCILDLHMG